MQLVSLLLLSALLLLSGIVPVRGFLDLPVWGLVIAGLLLTHLTIASVTIFLHRHQAHRALELHPGVSHLFRFWLWLTTGMVTKQWVAVHRKHHAKCETSEDPHSPQVFGIRKVLWSGAELYTEQAEIPENLEKYGRGTPADWLERHLYSQYTHLGLAIMMIADVMLFGALGITVWAIQMAWIPFWAAGVVNGLGHYLGYRNFETGDASTNLVPWGILIGGEELHNNHHAYPASARLSNRRWEFDIGWMYIRLLERLGLARVKKVAPRSVIRADKPLVDQETVLAMVQNRAHIMAMYGGNVILPALRHELRLADASMRKMIRAARPMMIREYLRLDENAQRSLQYVLQASQSLATVYRFKEELRGLLTNVSLNQDKRLEALREWCARAEATSIDVLREFAMILRGYSLQPCLLSRAV